MSSVRGGLAAGGLLLGIQHDEVYTNATRHLHTGDTLLLATDGITEARRESEFLGYEGMIELARQHASEMLRCPLRESSPRLADVPGALPSGEIQRPYVHTSPSRKLMAEKADARGTIVNRRKRTSKVNLEFSLRSLSGIRPFGTILRRETVEHISHAPKHRLAKSLSNI